MIPIISKTHLSLLVVGIFVLGVSFLFSEPKDQNVDTVEHVEMEELERLQHENSALIEENTRLQEKVISLEKSLENFGKGTTVYMNRDVFMSNAPLPNTTEFLFEEQLATGLVVLYQDEIGFKHSFYSTKNGFWTNSDYGHVSEFGISWALNYDDEIPILSIGGIISNEDVSDIMVKHNGRKRGTRIVNIDDTRRVWYLIDELEVPESVNEPEVKIEALGADGTVLWKN